MNSETSLLDDALNLIAQEGYANFTLVNFAKRSGHPLAAVYKQFSSRIGVVEALAHRIDEQLKASAEVSPDLQPRDRVFDVAMTRFELLEPYKPACLVCVRELVQVPKDAVLLMPRTIRVAETILALAQIDISGLKGRLRLQTMVAVYTRVLKTWLLEDDPGLPKTMAMLDRWLRGPEQINPVFWGETRKDSLSTQETATQS